VRGARATLDPATRLIELTDDEAMVADLAHRTLGYFVREVNRDSGLVRDSTNENAPATIAGSGLALTCYVVAAERGWIPREEAAARALTTLRFFWTADQSGAPDGTGHRGFFYHFLDALRGRRVWKSELSTIDSAIVFAGALAAAEYFDRETPAERELRELAVKLYARAEWTWTLRGRGAITHGWTPERGFLPHDWLGYNEALLVYVLALGSPTHPIPPAAYDRWLSTYRWKRLYGHEHVYGGPLFMHQLSHIWIDFRGIRDAFMRDKGIDYFENSRRATYVQREYAIRNPRRFVGYGRTRGGFRRATAPDPRAVWFAACGGASTTTGRGARRSALMMARSRRGRWLRRSRSRQRSFFPRSATALRSFPGSLGNTGTRGA
jgi:hypothetical protein